MSFIANRNKEYALWDYLTGDLKSDISIVRDRYYFLDELSRNKNFKISLRNPYNDRWTKWVKFPGELLQIGGKLAPAIDVHRSILDNEIVIESDYPTYEENHEAAKLIGKIIENKGFIPHYYYSGNKSIHIHVFFDWDCLKNLSITKQNVLKVLFKSSKQIFKGKFIEWLRIRMISCWDTNAKEFDKDLIKANHLIRCELSRNELGHKTFLGYTYKDMSFVPYLCNEENRIYPKIGKIKLSGPKDIDGLIDEFIKFTKTEFKIDLNRRKNQYLINPGYYENPKNLRGCVKIILGDEFKKVRDGCKRGMFILLNELRKTMGDSQARIIINDWNKRMGLPIKPYEIEYRLNNKTYTLTCKYIHDFLKDIGLNVIGKCKEKVYK